MHRGLDRVCVAILEKQSMAESIFRHGFAYVISIKSELLKLNSIFSRPHGKSVETFSLTVTHHSAAASHKSSKDTMQMSLIICIYNPMYNFKWYYCNVFFYIWYF